MEEPTKPLSETLATRSADALRELATHAQTASASRRERLSRLESQLTQQLDAITSTLAAEQAADDEIAADCDRQRAELAALREQLDQLNRELDDRTESLAELEGQLAAREVTLGEQSESVTKREAALAEQQAALEAQKKEFEQAQTAAIEARESQTVLQKQRDDFAEKLAQAQASQEAAERKSSEHELRIAELEKELADKRAALAARESAWQNEKVAVEQERDALKLELAGALQKTNAAANDAAAVAERDELKQKFALALEDVQRFRARVTMLEQELAQRPEAGQADSAELVSLRAERDALAERVEALERAAPPPADEQHVADLQRRFELAVEDVRELKTRNAELESRLAATRQAPAGHSHGDGMDWESQKRRLLASLEDFSDATDEERRERTTIESTIQITDALVAEKDQLIAELKAQVAAGAPAAGSPDDQQAQEIEERLDADEVIRQHRQKAEQLEQELEAKLRAAELELSVERAKIARQKVELDQIRHDLEAERKGLGSAGAAGGGGAPRRRWLSKLGLGSEETD